MEYESTEWIALRNSKLYDWFEGNQSAVDFCITIGSIAEIWDDLIDKDKDVSNAEINETFWDCLIRLPNNYFFNEHKAFLTPLMIR